MDDEVIAHMRDRIRRTRRVIELAHDPEMIALLERIIVEIEADIDKLKTRQIETPQPPVPRGS